jgi:hypothetical protein
VAYDHRCFIQVLKPKLDEEKKQNVLQWLFFDFHWHCFKYSCNGPYPCIYRIF